MKITSIETLRTAEFANVIWVRVHTDAGIIGLGETFYGAGAVEAHIHDTLAGAPARPRPAAYRGDPSRDAQSADGAVQHRRRIPRRLGRSTSRYGTCSAKSATSRCTRCSAACAATRQRIYNTCAGYGTSAPPTSGRSPTWNLGEAAGPYEDLTAS